MIRIGLTGNIGSGKSTVARIFETFDVPVFYADAEGRRVLEADAVKLQIQTLFGNGVFTDGTINRQKLAEIVFRDKEQLDRLNAIIHPAVRNSFEKFTAQNSGSPYIIYEAAIMIESGSYKNFDKIIFVSADRELRISRVIARDKVTRETVLLRMQNQWPEKKKLPVAQFVINNNDNRLLIPQVLNIHRHLVGEVSQ
jgi:dephospho-CoA kinase